jgi:hypothetical protein
MHRGEDAKLDELAWDEPPESEGGYELAMEEAQEGESVGNISQHVKR